MTIKYFMTKDFFQDNIKNIISKLSYFEKIEKIDFLGYNQCIVYVKIKNS